MSSREAFVTENDLSFYTSERDGVPTVKRVQLVSADLGFTDPREVCKKPIFSSGQYDEFNRMFTLRAGSEYFYALTSAMLNKASKMLESLNEEATPKDDSPGPEKVSDPKPLLQIVNKWKDDNKQNEKYFTRNVMVSTPARYYTGSQGDQIANEAGFNKLGEERLAAIANACSIAKDDAYTVIKERTLSLGEEDQRLNQWLTIRYNQKDAAKQEILKLRTDYYTKYGEKETAEQVEREYYLKKPRKRSKAKESKGPSAIGQIDSAAYQAMEDFNLFFCINAINKDGLVVFSY